MLGKHDDAMSELTTAVNERPGFAQAEYVLGAMYGNHGDNVNARVHFQKAVDAEPGNDRYEAAFETREWWEIGRKLT